MGMHLDLDDESAGHQLAMAELAELRAEIERLRELCDDLYSDLLAAGFLAPRDCGAYALIQETIKLRRDRWARKQAPNG